jgi:hypothetical protein
MLHAATVLAALALGGGTYTVSGVQSGFKAQTGVPLVRLASASTPAVTTLTTRPLVTLRFGHFELYVLRPSTARPTRRAFLGTTRPDARGIYWTRDQQGGFVATTVFGSNLVIGWFPPHGRKRVDARWQRLQAVVRRL